MLPTEGEDLLEQLSGDLGIPEFLQDLPMLEDNAMNGPGNLYESLINDSIPPVTSAAALFPDLSNSLMDSKDCMTIDFNTTTFPPSPSNSDTSSGFDSKETFAEAPVSPPSSIVNGITFPSPIVDVSNIKIPIPKIQKPSKLP